MGYMKLSISHVIEAHPGLNIGEMTEKAIEDHATANGCVFEEDARDRALEYLNLNPLRQSSDLPEDMRIRLGYALEALEIKCEHRGGPDKEKL